MKISIAQIRVIPGRPSVNFETIKKHVTLAKEQGADLIVFPEMCVGGYFLGDRYLDHDYCVLVDSYNDQIKALSNDIGIIWGNLHYRPLDRIIKGRDGRPVRFNAAFFAYNNEFVKRENNKHDGLYIKHLNPDYRMFDDSRYYLSALEIMNSNKSLLSEFMSPFIFEKAGKIHRINLEVCEDMWEDDYPYKATQEILKNKPDLLVNVSSSPWTLNKEIARKRHLSNKAKVPMVYVNAVGMQDTGKNVFIFDGGSLAYGKNGALITELNDRFHEENKVIDVDTSTLTTRNYKTSKLFDAITTAIKFFDEQMFNKGVKWIIGLSGGIDSALNLALLTYSLGKDRILAYNLPSRFNSEKTIGNATKLASSLGVSLNSYSIEKLIEETKRLFEIPVSGPVEENIHARLRGHVLSTLAQMHGGVICNNGNKVEIALGYCTLYGDTIGALSPLGDLTKIQINELALEINELYGKEIIPTNLIARIENGIPFYELPPSAELKEKQVDPMKWGYHDWLLTKIISFPTRNLKFFIDDYFNNRLDDNVKKLLSHYGLDKKEAFIDDLKWFFGLLNSSVYKRIQMPPIVAISRGAFGYDYRETQAKVEDYLNSL